MKLTVYLCKYLGVKEDEGVYSKGGISKRPWQVPLLPVIIPELYTQQLTTISLSVPTTCTCIYCHMFIPNQGACPKGIYYSCLHKVPYKLAESMYRLERLLKKQQSIALLASHCIQNYHA